MHADQDVLDGRHVLEEADILVGAGNTEPCDAVGRKPGDISAVEQDLAFFRDVETGDAVEEGGLAGAIRADDAVNALLLDFQVDMDSEPARPPKRFVTFLETRTAIGLSPARGCVAAAGGFHRRLARLCLFFVQFELAARLGYQTFRSGEHHGDQHGPIDQVAIFGKFPQELGQTHQDQAHRRGRPECCPCRR